MVVAFLGILSEGGVGIVYEAEQEHPHRRIAIEVSRAGQASAETVRRFAREGEALGRLQHPGIAQVFEVGAAETPPVQNISPCRRCRRWSRWNGQIS